jgi:fructose/tagatose bisphosphate aldolase
MADVRRAAKLGFRKMNVATGLHQAFGKALADAADADWQGSPYDSWKPPLFAGRSAMKAFVANYLRDLGCVGLL